MEYFKHFSMRKTGLAFNMDKNAIFRILHSPSAQQKVQDGFQKLDISVERVRAELAKLAFYDPREFYDDQGNLVPLHELEDAAGAAIAGVEVSEIFEGVGQDRHHVGYLKKVKHVDKGQNLERLGRYLKMFGDKQSGTTQKDRLDDVVSAFKAGPVRKGDGTSKAS